MTIFSAYIFLLSWTHCLAVQHASKRLAAPPSHAGAEGMLLRSLCFLFFSYHFLGESLTAKVLQFLFTADIGFINSPHFTFDLESPCCSHSLKLVRDNSKTFYFLYTVNLKFSQLINTTVILSNAF